MCVAKIDVIATVMQYYNKITIKKSFLKSDSKLNSYMYFEKIIYMPIHVHTRKIAM